MSATASGPRMETPSVCPLPEDPEYEWTPVAASAAFGTEAAQNAWGVEEFSETLRHAASARAAVPLIGEIWTHRNPVTQRCAALALLFSALAASALVASALLSLLLSACCFRLLLHFHRAACM
jgi:hypothetical protein